MSIPKDAITETKKGSNHNKTEICVENTHVDMIKFYPGGRAVNQQTTYKTNDTN